MNNKIDLKDKLINDFSGFEKSLNGELNSGFHKIRKDALSSFNELGFPTRKVEEWRFTHINGIFHL